jgi:hypothetical protein
MKKRQFFHSRTSPKLRLPTRGKIIMTCFESFDPLQRATDALNEVLQLRELLELADTNYDTFNEKSFKGLRMLLDCYRSNSDCMLEILQYALEELSREESQNEVFPPGEILQTQPKKIKDKRVLQQIESQL